VLEGMHLLSTWTCQILEQVGRRWDGIGGGFVFLFERWWPPHGSCSPCSHLSWRPPLPLPRRRGNRPSRRTSTSTRTARRRQPTMSGFVAGVSAEFCLESYRPLTTVSSFHGRLCAITTARRSASPWWSCWPCSTMSSPR
jgi:hypothetical protein